MSLSDFMNKIRHWDNLTSRWMMRHVYFMFFQIALFIIFLFWFANVFEVIDIAELRSLSTVERILKTQTINTTLIVFILLLNSFWMLYIFNTIQRIRTILKDISFNISRLRLRQKDHS